MKNLDRTTAVNFCDSFVIESGKEWLNRKGVTLADGTPDADGKPKMTGDTPLAREVQTRVNLNIADSSKAASSIELTCGGTRYRVVFEDVEDPSVIRVSLKEVTHNEATKKVVWRSIADGLIAWDGWIYD